MPSVVYTLAEARESVRADEERLRQLKQKAEASKRKAAKLKLRRLERNASLEELCLLTPREFEEAVADILRMRSYREVEVVGGPHDLCADVVAFKGSRRVVVQCKRYAKHRKIGSGEIQKFLGMARIHHRADDAIFVTTAGFTPAARALAKEHEVRLISGSALIGWRDGARSRGVS